ncbi:hypothetical protein LCM02_08315 [Lutimonas saemankumensis]|uniref:hypothetical protein n=1 Tax=Lutimonas saemankumensis TaxID=483016 RepID=UPI001CD7B188|nr:hypothetical protein [Lutimonas saemankumensis]MCA0932452.1 hypothetical protein [Lutimonas saemankumensis]
MKTEIQTGVHFYVFGNRILKIIVSLNMKSRAGKFILALIITSISLVTLLSCIQFSEHVNDPYAGLNGGFEVSEKGIPVNWLMYTPNTVPSGDFEIIIDTEEFKEGKQSLKFKVTACSSAGGRFSPGFTNQFHTDQFDADQFNADPGNTYTLSFWVKNEQSEFRVMAGGVSPKTGEMKILIQSNEEIKAWKQFEFKVPVAENFDEIRIEVNILKPGIFWIDDLQIVK